MNTVNLWGTSSNKTVLHTNLFSYKWKFISGTILYSMTKDFFSGGIFYNA